MCCTSGKDGLCTGKGLSRRDSTGMPSAVVPGDRARKPQSDIWANAVTVASPRDSTGNSTRYRMGRGVASEACWAVGVAQEGRWGREAARGAEEAGTAPSRERKDGGWWTSASVVKWGEFLATQVGSPGEAGEYEPPAGAMGAAGWRGDRPWRLSLGERAARKGGEGGRGSRGGSSSSVRSNLTYRLTVIMPRKYVRKSDKQMDRTDLESCL
ncbi:hypothetical protein GWK47_004664 [Chionoecetes opilio]|uniref:Uncharacterized protein n=1 Tax=Chionoecetes opilio TaxID=41210 RepID=A0A8J5CM44_CHIOP|nr:hypothetical protein GWK47_004664 [Chionoecetes opilio]